MSLDLNLYPYIAVDTETTGLEWWNDKMFGFSISTPDGKDYYEDIRRPTGLSDRSLFKDYRGTLIFHNAKFDLHFLREAGFKVPLGNIQDTMVRAALIDEHRFNYDLDSLGLDYLGVGKEEVWQELADLFGGQPTKNAQMKNLKRAPVRLVAKYAKRDTRLTLDLWEKQEKIIEEDDLKKVHGLECDLLPVLYEIEMVGINVDIDRAEEAYKEADELVETGKKKLNDMAGFTVNPNPSKSIHDLFRPTYDKDEKKWFIGNMQIPTTEAGNASINADVLRALPHPEAKLILDIRKMAKLRDTFITKHIMERQQNGIVYPNYNQTKNDNAQGTISGRLSMNSPAMQQIPKRDKEIAKIARALFIPRKGMIWNCRDWSQMDFRMFAHYLKDPNINEMYHKDPHTDFHQMVADMMGIPRKAKFAGDGANAKQINLGLSFGMGDTKMTKLMGLPTEMALGWNGDPREVPGEEGRALFDQYHKLIPGLKPLLNRISSVAKSRGYIKTIMGRHSRFPDKRYVYKAGSLLFQGSAADSLKVKLIEVHNYLKGTEGRIILNVHDEFDNEYPRGNTELDQGVKEIVEKFDGIDTPIKFNIPIRSDSGVGENWWEASKD